MSNYFITGISTDVGKTVVAAIVTQALEADYWKPIQTGAGIYGDAATVKDLISNKKSVIHPEAVLLKEPLSPHAAAAIEGVTINLDTILRPVTANNMIIEGAGGILVPLNDTHTIRDLIHPDDKVIVVSAGYLGSINHTLLTIEALKARGLQCAGIVYNQVTLPDTIEIIEKMTQVPTIGHIDLEKKIDKSIVANYAVQFKSKLRAI